MEPTMEELIDKTQLSPKIIPTSSHQLGGSTKGSHFSYSTAVISSQYHSLHQHHLILMTLSTTTTSSHINIIINNNINSY
ncbi:hypothetical protein GmHk_19G054357 [Glycine max]|nr:hypothetical protein GmHk_19G054357 [Glycine max]